MTTMLPSDDLQASSKLAYGTGATCTFDAIDGSMEVRVEGALRCKAWSAVNLQDMLSSWLNSRAANHPDLRSRAADSGDDSPTFANSPSVRIPRIVITESTAS